MARKRTRLKVLRAERDLTQLKVARLAGLSAARYWQIEAAYGSEPSDAEQAAVAAALGVKVSEVEWPNREEVRAS